ncbi:putative extracellular tail, of 10TM putative phosphate transporter [Lyophyllum shimeji]|uniref:Extracellular tail, of 10TM putative phosphate transporter n=1 Tax=Lyophyllum shimeji TaxID=47721 RepID=A0A9P3PU43_LYOSH|nr:putative extracellular tail, of 10TM putative phosphate transporter [Lyophyllum shimeji]
MWRGVPIKERVWKWSIFVALSINTGYISQRIAAKHTSCRYLSIQSTARRAQALARSDGEKKVCNAPGTPRPFLRPTMSTDITNAKSASTATFVTALVFNAVVFGAEIAAFTLLRPWFKAIYEPRTYVPPPSKRIHPLSNSLLLWPVAVFKADYRGIIKANGMDSYFFVRFLRMMARIFLPIWLISWAVLLPDTSVNTRVGNNSKLDLFVFGNIAPDKSERYIAHIVLVYLFTLWIFYNIKIEMTSFVLKRQQHLIDPVHAKSVQANTLLITGIPSKYLSKDALFNLFNDLPGGVKQVWINRNLKELPDIHDRRIAACNKLEAAETALMKTAAKLRFADRKKTGKKGGKSADVEASPALGTDAVIVPREQRPQHRLGMIPFFGEKVDTIEWAREEIRVCTELLEQGRRIIENDRRGIKDRSDEPEKDDEEKESTESAKSGKKKSYPPLNSAFVTFHKQIAAHMGMQVLTHHAPYRMSGKYVEVSPEDVIWANLGMNPYEQKIRLAISYAATAGLIILWAFPVAFVGAVSNIRSVCQKAHWLAWICELPDPVVGIISGILPPVLLAVLMMLLPIILRLLARFEGIPKYTGLELSLMTRFFIFQVIHSFLIVTLSSGLIKAIQPILNNPSSVAPLLAQNLPGASTFFLTYVVLQGLSGVAGGFLQIVPLIIYYVKLFILGSTPRAVYDIKYGLRNVAWGTTFPGVTLLVVIALGYSIISPVINGLACATFFMFYQLYKYLFLWQYGQPSTSDTGGLFFPKAIQHVFVGLYVQQVCLCALFFLARDENNNASAVPEGALMVVLIVLTAGFHTIISNSYGPLLHALPLSLKDKTFGGTPTIPDQRMSDEIPLSANKSIEQHHLAAIGVTRREGSGSDAKDMQARKTEEEYGFAHPAVSRPQRTVWLPRDAMGMAEEEERACRDAGVDVSYRNAVMDERGKVDVSGSPPDLVGEE